MIESTEQFFDIIFTAKHHLKGKAQQDFLKRACKDYLAYRRKQDD